MYRFIEYVAPKININLPAVKIFGTMYILASPYTIEQWQGMAFAL